MRGSFWVVTALLAAAGRAEGQCQPSWSRRFEPTGFTFQGQYPAARFSAVFDDDGPGPHAPMLYVSGDFVAIGGVAVQGLARWTGSRWEAVGSGGIGGGDLVVFDDDGAGPHLPALYVIASANYTEAIRKWDGQQWTVVALGSPLWIDSYPDVSGGPNHLFVLPDGGTGPLRLYTSANYLHIRPSAFMADGALFRLDAGGWTQVASGGEIDAAAVFDPDGAGPTTQGLYFAHTSSSDNPTSGSLWSSAVSRLTAAGFTDTLVGGSVTHERVQYASLATFADAGVGSNLLYVGGMYAVTGGGAVGPHLSRWSATGLTPIAGDVDAAVTRLQVLSDDPVNPGHAAMYAMGLFGSIGGILTSKVARWDGAAWSGIGPGIAINGASGQPLAVESFDDDGAGPRPRFLYAVGNFDSAGYDPASGIARWDGHYWEAPGTFLNNSIHAMVAADLGGGPALYMGGTFTNADGLLAVSVAKWDGQAFGQLTAGMNNHVDALAVYQGSLYAAGKFTTASPVQASHIARWTGTAWAAVGEGQNDNIDALAVYDDGSGTALYAGGRFLPGRIARWNGQQWSVVGGGTDGEVTALCVQGGALYAAGTFGMAGSVPAQGLARWDAGGWHGVAGVPVSQVTAMASHAGGLFVGGASADGLCVRALHGQTWTTLPPPAATSAPASVQALYSYDEDGAGPSPAGLYASVSLLINAGSEPVPRVMRWDGRRWLQIASGLDKPALAFAPLGNGTLYVGGEFRTVEGQTSWYLASLSACPTVCYANCDASTTPPVLNVNDFQCFLNRFAAGDPGANCDMSTAAPVLNVNDFTCFLNQYAAGCP